MTPQDVIDQVRPMVNDVRFPQRYSDTVLLGFVNQTVRRMVGFRPDLFSLTASVPTAAAVSEQQLPAGAVRLVEIFRVVGGPALEEVDRGQFN
jgi:hypothetical protein